MVPRFVIVATLFAAAAFVLVERTSLCLDRTGLVSIPAGSFEYREAGEFLRDGVPVDGPLKLTAFERPIAIMKWQ